ncbi:MAG TPA: dTDP-4-dehydrorhamnose reductase [candidate division WOR-3 bacterium]|uniref:dTDP-4-dehydrorhamnose reductase n=1 Tax=candidate division WOR-3 bacterium TaxID=2052148 RepID=A0A9C9ELI7_UNCW3|nr:dTDP-4-dehydrorhamnose reductase [candidate division WOR-3 bacterium]
MKVFISGAHGALGTEMQNVLKREGINFLATDLNQLDVGNFKKTNETLLKYRPDVILHFAAISNVDECEKNKDLAFQTNALSTLGLAVISKKINAKILYVSTNFVFDGRAEKAYSEYSRTAPINEYGRTKLLGENYIKDLCDRYFIVRTAWLFGKNSKTFISKFIVSEDKPRSIDVICDQFGSFTYTVDLAETIWLLIKSENYGVYHIVNRDMGSWLDFALKAKELMKFKTDIKPIKTEELNLPAPRPRFAPLESKNFEFFFEKSMRTWQEALIAFIKSITTK